VRLCLSNSNVKTLIPSWCILRTAFATLPLNDRSPSRDYNSTYWLSSSSIIGRSANSNRPVYSCSLGGELTVFIYFAWKHFGGAIIGSYWVIVEMPDPHMLWSDLFTSHWYDNFGKPGVSFFQVCWGNILAKHTLKRLRQTQGLRRPFHCFLIRYLFFGLTNAWFKARQKRHSN